MTIHSSNVTWCFENNWWCQSMLVSGGCWAIGDCVGDLIRHTQDVMGCGCWWFIGCCFGTHFCVIGFGNIMGIFWVALGWFVGVIGHWMDFWIGFESHIWCCLHCALSNFFGTYLWVEATCGEIESLAVWVLSARYCRCFGLHTSFCFGVKVDVEVALVGFVDCHKTWCLAAWHPIFFEPNFWRLFRV